MYNIWVQSWSLFKGLYNFLNPRGIIANVMIMPAMMVLMYALMGRYALDPSAGAFFAIGMNVSSMSYTVIGNITMGYANDRWFGMLNYLYITGGNRFINFLCRCPVHYALGLLSGTAGMIMIRLVTPIDFGAVNWTGMIVATLVVNASFCAFGQFLGIFSIILVDWLNALAFALSITLILSGVIIPINIFPTALQEIGKLLPMTNGLAAIRAAFSGAPFSSFYFDIIREVLTGIVYYMIGYFGFVIFERVAKRTGNLELEQFA